MVLLGPQGLQGLYKASQALGSQAQLAGSVFSFGDSEARAIGPADGIWVISPYGSPADDARFTADLDASGVAPDDIALRRSAGPNAWLAVHAAVDLAAGIQGDVIAESMTTALHATSELQVEGLGTWDPARARRAGRRGIPPLPGHALPGPHLPGWAHGVRGSGADPGPPGAAALSPGGVGHRGRRRRGASAGSCSPRSGTLPGVRR